MSPGTQQLGQDPSLHESKISSLPSLPLYLPLSLLLPQLVYGQFRETQVSIKENKSSYTLKTKAGILSWGVLSLHSLLVSIFPYFSFSWSQGKSVELVDVPGDERVRQTLFNKYKGSMRY